ncbi:MAG: hypothetical protein HOH33_05235 [Verrucomicrobia bacterium]|jgi:hypothetical protein|nr:hypothetical protein [Verrucomicrobiota bacterium]
MKALLIQSLNSLWLVILFIGVPAISSMRLGTLQIASRPIWHMLTLWGVMIALCVNAVLYWKGVRSKQEKRICLRWIFGYALLGCTFLAYSAKWIDFAWLKDLLLRAKRMM